MSGENNSDSSTSESEVSACSSSYKPLKALYSDKVKIPVNSAPLYENIVQFEAAQKKKNEIIPFGKTELVVKREQEKERKRVEEEAWLEEKNKQRFAQYGGLVPRKEFKARNVLTRMGEMEGPLARLKDWVDKGFRVKITTRKDRGVRGVLHATIVAYDKQWNLALSDVHEIWEKKIKQGKQLPGPGTPVPRGTAATISPVPNVTKTHLGKGNWLCTRNIPQLMVRGEHIVLIHLLVP